MSVETESDVELFEAPAVWSVRCPGCGAHCLACDGHRTKWAREIISHGVGANCKHCGRWGETLDTLFVIVPIKAMRDADR